MSEPRPSAAEGSAEATGESTLLRGLLEAAPEACSHFCTRYFPRLYRFAAVRLEWDVQLAEDVAMQAPADGMRNIRRFSPRKSTLGAWLYGIAKRHIVRERRRQTRRRSIPRSAQVPLEAAAVAAGVDIALNAVPARLDAQRQVAEVAAALSGMEFGILVLSCIDQLSVREIGRVGGRSESAVHSPLHRARRTARERLVCDDE